MSQSTDADVIVLGAGIVGVSTALHLQKRGLSVVLVDRLGKPAGETSFGNAGVIEGSIAEPHLFPRDLGALARYALNLEPEARYQISALPKLAPWLWQYFRHAAPERVAVTLAALRPLTHQALSEHQSLIDEAGAHDLVNRRGWLHLYRTANRWDGALKKAERARAQGFDLDILDEAGFRALEPEFVGPMLGALKIRDTINVKDPGALCERYCQLFLRQGGRLATGDARSLSDEGGRWRMAVNDGGLSAPDVVMALGPWSNDVYERFAFRMPLGVKRGYHRHYAWGPQGDSALTHPVYDATGGFLLAPMTRGIRLTTGAEFAERDSPPTPAQIDETHVIAKAIYPKLGASLDREPWMGRRPCLPDMLPVVGPAPGRKGLWFNFGHQHLGLTLGPVTGRLLAALMTQPSEALIDPRPYRADRFA